MSCEGIAETLSIRLILYSSRNACDVAQSYASQQTPALSQ